MLSASPSQVTCECHQVRAIWETETEKLCIGNMGMENSALQHPSETPPEGGVSVCICVRVCVMGDASCNSRRHDDP